jgi:hypothetical protein
MPIFSKAKREIKIPGYIPLKPWTVNAISAFGERNRMKFPEAAAFLLESDLNSRGYCRKDYEPGEPAIIRFDHRLSGKKFYLGTRKILSFEYRNFESWKF